MQSTEQPSPAMPPQLASRVWRNPESTAAEKTQAAHVLRQEKMKKHYARAAEGQAREQEAKAREGERWAAIFAETPIR